MGGHAGQTEIVFVPKVTKENSAKKVLTSHVMSNSVIPINPHETRSQTLQKKPEQLFGWWFKYHIIR